MIIAIDFDGTLCEHKWPEIGRELPGAIAWCKSFAEAGAKLILYTMRSDHPQDDYDGYPYTLTDAVDWCRDRGLEFWKVNENPQTWTTSPKVHAKLCIDDRNLGCPLDINGYCDWSAIGPQVMQMLEVPNA